MFSDEAERVYKSEGLAAFAQSERASAKEPLSGGPFRGFLRALHELQQTVPATASVIRTALVTARSAPAHERVIRILRAWNVRIDESIFLGGMDKSAFLQAYQADVFFDDHCGVDVIILPTNLHLLSCVHDASFRLLLLRAPFK